MNNEKNQTKTAIDKNKLIIIISAISAAILLIVGAAIAISMISTEEGDTGAFEGVYSLSISGIGSSYYTFRADGTGVRSYTAEDSEITEEFTYTLEGKNITFSWKDSQKTESHSFETGKMGNREVIFINEVTYYKQ